VKTRAAVEFAANKPLEIVEPSALGYYRIRPPIKPVMLGDFSGSIQGKRWI